MNSENTFQFVNSLRSLKFSDSLISKILDSLHSQIDLDECELIFSKEIIDQSMSGEFGVKFAELVDLSHSSISDVIKGLIFLSHHKKYIDANLKDRLGFLFCCAEYQNLHPNSGELSFLVSEFLRELKSE